MRALPSWFDINHYNYLSTCTPRQWYLEISTRRELKALFELRRIEPEIFIDNTPQTTNDLLAFYESFFLELENLRTQTEIDTQKVISIKQTPNNIQRYIDFKIIPLFDLLHWYELNEEATPTHEELKNWLFPTTEKHIRYIVGDAKKMLKVALLECDSLKNLEII